MKKLDPQNLTQARVLVVGDVMLDSYMHGRVERISPEAPIPIVNINRHDERLGGAANVAANIGTLGAHAHLIGIVGKDVSAQRLDSLSKQFQLKTTWIADSKIQTTHKVRIIGHQQQLLRLDFEDAPHTTSLKKLAKLTKTQLPHCDVLLLSDYGKGALTEVTDLIQSAHQHRKPVVIDPKGDRYEVYAGASVLTPNTKELKAVIGNWASETELEEKAQNLRAHLKLTALIMTRGAEGMSCFDELGHYRIASRAREVFDVTGAGDTVIAVLSSLIGIGYTPREALPLANHAGGIVVGKLGTATLSLEELLA